MENARIVDKLLHVFDLPDLLAMGYSVEGPTRIMLRYDRESRQRRFTVLSKHVPPHMTERIEKWLEANMGINGVDCDMHFHEEFADGEDHHRLRAGRTR